LVVFIVARPVGIRFDRPDLPAVVVLGLFSHLPGGVLFALLLGS
jgi:hypothetical protein